MDAETEAYWKKQWTSADFRKMNSVLHDVSFDLNVIRCQFEEFERYGTGTLKTQFDHSPDEEVRYFMLSLKTARAIKFILFLELSSLDELCEYSAESLYDSYSSFTYATKAAVSEIEEKLAEFGKPMKPSKKEDCDDCTS